MGSAKYTIEEAVLYKQSKNLTLVKTLLTSTNTLKKGMQNNNISEIKNVESKMFHRLHITCFKILSPYLLL